MSLHKLSDLTPDDIDRIISMAWEDRTSFDSIEAQFGLNESAVIKIMRSELKENSFRRWRKRVSGRKTKHRNKLDQKLSRFKSNSQRQITGNRISKKKY